MSYLALLDVKGYSPNKAERLLEALRMGKSLNDCRMEGIIEMTDAPAKWCRANPDFKRAFDAALEDGAVELAFSLLDVPYMVATDKNKEMLIKTRQYLVEKHGGHRYNKGEKVADMTISDAELENRKLQLLEQLKGMMTNVTLDSEPVSVKNEE